MQDANITQKMPTILVQHKAEVGRVLVDGKRIFWKEPKTALKEHTCLKL
jgi:hypothetical protein